ncbi:hypothetical protein [Comamonas testosteroni]|uniref:hypothetical protein n=1 Tax=Comamonas testosteroni TaxID=285 RepID=UPI00069118ED|nr:hypothetical protein [Comamonas testosteroni]
MSSFNETAQGQAKVPDVGALVEFGMNSFQTGPATYRVTAWLRAAPQPTLNPDDFIGHILFEACQEIPDASDGKKKRMQFCLRDEATHLSLKGIAGAIAPIELCKVTGMVDWPTDQIEKGREKARRLGEAHQMIF